MIDISTSLLAASVNPPFILAGLMLLAGIALIGFSFLILSKNTKEIKKPVKKHPVSAEKNPNHAPHAPISPIISPAPSAPLPVNKPIQKAESQNTIPNENTQKIKEMTEKYAAQQQEHAKKIQEMTEKYAAQQQEHAKKIQEMTKKYAAQQQELEATKETTIQKKQEKHKIKIEQCSPAEKESLIQACNKEIEDITNTFNQLLQRKKQSDQAAISAQQQMYDAQQRVASSTEAVKRYNGQ